MKIKKIPKDSRFPYYKKCRKCGNTTKIYTEEGETPYTTPEYYTDAYVQCRCCCNFLKFEIPAN